MPRSRSAAPSTAAAVAAVRAAGYGDLRADFGA